MYLHSMFLLQHVHVVVSWGTTVNMLACIIVLSGFRRGAGARCSCTSADSAVPPRGAHGNLCCMHVSTTDACSMGLDQQRVAEFNKVMFTRGFAWFLAVVV